LQRHQAGLEKKVFEGIEKLAIEVKNIVDKMPDQGKKRHVACDVFLAAMLAKAPGNIVAAIKAAFFRAFGLVRHVFWF
jgi:hypothetical protein